MVFRERLGLGVAPLLLRLAVAATFMWTGAAKFVSPVALSPQDEATLRMIETGGAQTPGAPSQPGDVDEPAETAGEPVALDGAYQLILAQDADEAPAAAEPEVAEADVLPDRTGKDQIALLVYAMATPNDEGKTLLPRSMGKGKWPVRIGFAVALTELICGVLILIGLITRVAALMVAGVMVGAIWMTTIGPVMIFGNPGWPGFFPILPALDYSTVETAQQTFRAWQTAMFQLAMLTASLSLVCLGAGPLSLDRFLFGKPGSPRKRKASGADDGDGDDGDGDD